MAVTTTALLVLGGRASTAHGDAILSISLNSGATITATENASQDTTTLSATNQAVTLSSLDRNSVNLTGLLTLNATSSGSASIVVTPFGNYVAQGYTGTFSITNGMLNYLSGTFSGEVFGKGSEIVLSASTPPAADLTLTSSVIGAAHLTRSTAATFVFSSVNPLVSIQGSSISSFTAAAAGTFDASIDAVPEPSSMLIAGLSAAGLIGYGLRRRKAAGG
jgi:hypothetical protein